METARKISVYEKWVLVLIVISVIAAYLCQTFWFSFDALAVILFIPIFLGVRYLLNHFHFFQIPKGKLTLLCFGLIGLFAWSWYWADTESQYFHYDKVTGGNKLPARLTDLLSGYTANEVRKDLGEEILSDAKQNRESQKSDDADLDARLELIEARIDNNP